MQAAPMLQKQILTCMCVCACVCVCVCVCVRVCVCVCLCVFNARSNSPFNKLCEEVRTRYVFEQTTAGHEVATLPRLAKASEDVVGLNVEQKARNPACTRSTHNRQTH